MMRGFLSCATWGSGIGPPALWVTPLHMKLLGAVPHRLVSPLFSLLQFYLAIVTSQIQQWVLTCGARFQTQDLHCLK